MACWCFLPPRKEYDEDEDDGLLLRGEFGPSKSMLFDAAAAAAAFGSLL